MQKFLLRGALMAAVLLALAPVARAQEDAPTQPALPFAGQASGYDLLVQAGQLIEDGPNGEPSSRDALSPAENLRRQRLAVARNAPALAKLREALALGVELPGIAPNLTGASADNLPPFAKARELARQLYQEAAVRAADGDALGAAQSDLDALRLGAQISRGVFINSLVGNAISAIGRKSLAQHAGALNAEQSRSVAAQWDAVSASKPTYADSLRAEKIYGVASMRGIMALSDLDDPTKRAEALAEAGKDDADPQQAQIARELLELRPADFEADFAARYDKAIERAALPYPIATQAGPIQGKTVYVDVITALVFDVLSRFDSERDLVADRLFAAALRLHAIKLESGAYPQDFDAGVDPFSPTLAPLIYQRTGDSYLLYSVGPDGMDENGAGIQTLEEDFKTGQTKVTERLRANSKGDIVAPAF